MKKIRNKNKGITLVSLVITIIILLILAGVGINMAVNSNGLFAKANEAVTKWDTAVAEEERIMENIMQQANEINSGTTGGGTTLTLPASWDSTKVVDVVEEGTRKAPVPKGYVASSVSGESTISGGLVIYQGTEEVNSTNHETALTTRNQFVWIPVDDINQMVMCKSNTSTSVCNLKLQADGTLKCTVHNSTELCGRLYNTEMTYTTYTNVEETKIYTTNMNFTDRSHTWDSDGYREPDIVSKEDKDGTDMEEAGIADKTVETYKLQLTSDFKAMAESVAKYGGFYVSRYKAGENGESKKSVEPVAAYTYGFHGLYSMMRTSGSVDKIVVSTNVMWRLSV